MRKRAGPSYLLGPALTRLCRGSAAELLGVVVQVGSQPAFRLGQADPDFLCKLALVLAAPAPPGAPGHLVDRAPFLPGTGPYMLSNPPGGPSTWRRRQDLLLVRNPHSWRREAEPGCWNFDGIRTLFRDPDGRDRTGAAA